MTKINTNLIFNILILFTTLILFLFMFEISIRLFFKDKWYPIKPENLLIVFKEDDAITWTLKPNASQRHKGLFGGFDVNVTINSMGFRDYENLNYTKNKILILGDSMTFGYGVELNETYSKRLEKELEPYNTTVINGGYVGGMALDTQYLYLEKNFDRLKPNMIIIAFHPNSDYADIQSNVWIYDKKDNLIKIDTRYKLDKDTGGWYIPSTTPNIFKVKPLWKLNKFLRAHSYSYQFFKDMITKINNGEISNQTALKIDCIVRKLKKLSTARQFKLVFVILPQRDDILNGNYRSNKIINILKEHDVMTIDLLPKLTQQIDPYTMDFGYDKHYTADTHKEVGKILAEELIVQFGASK